MYKPVWNFFSEVLGTFVLVLVATALFSKRVAPAGVAVGLGPMLVGALVWGVGLSLGGTTGYAINPARDFGPRIAHTLLPVAGKGGSGWGYVGAGAGAIWRARLWLLVGEDSRYGLGCSVHDSWTTALPSCEDCLRRFRGRWP